MIIAQAYIFFYFDTFLCMYIKPSIKYSKLFNDFNYLTFSKIAMTKSSQGYEIA